MNNWARLCRLGRDALFTSHEAGFDANAGTEAAESQRRCTDAAWPGGAWPSSGPGDALHQVGLMLSNSAGGRLGELAALLDSGEIAWSLATHVRGVLEVCGDLFRIYTRPYVPHVGNAIPDEAVLEMFANAHLLIVQSAFTARTLCQTYLDLDPSDAARQAALRHADSELARIAGAYGQHYDPTTTDTSSRNRLALGGHRLDAMTTVLDHLAAWMWPDPRIRPRPIYRTFSGHAHTSLDADSTLYDIEDSPTRRSLTRRVERDFIIANVAAANIVFQRTFSRLTGYYGWDEGPLHAFSEELARSFPQHFAYGP